MTSLFLLQLLSQIARMGTMVEMVIALRIVMINIDANNRECDRDCDVYDCDDCEGDDDDDAV